MFCHDLNQSMRSTCRRCSSETIHFLPSFKFELGCNTSHHGFADSFFDSLGRLWSELPSSVFPELIILSFLQKKNECLDICRLCQLFPDLATFRQSYLYYGMFVIKKNKIIADQWMEIEPSL